MSAPDEISVTRRWVRAGVAFGAPIADSDLDLERLLLDTARTVSTNPRLAVLPVTWLVHYDLCVARHRLAHLAGEELESGFVPALGYLMDCAHEHLGRAPFRDAITVCAERLEREPVEPAPLYDTQRGSPRLIELARSETSEVGRRWGRWARPFTLRPDAVRPPQWVMRHNPHFRERAHLEGDLRASIIATLRWDPDAGTSAVEIQHRCGCRSYPPVLHAIHQLERAGTIERVRVGTSKRIRLTGSAA